ncbi:MAG: glycosyltransferase family 4 protein [Deltaproteobacteria bacterium]
MINVVSVISELRFGGGENRLLNFARAIDRSRFQHTVATVFAPNPHDTLHSGSLRHAFDESGIELVELGVPHPGSSRSRGVAKVASTAKALATAVARLRQLIVSRRADVVDAHLETALYTAVPAAASARVPAAITLYSELDVWKVIDGTSYRSLVFPPFRRFNLRLCSALISDSAARLADFQRYLGGAAPPMHVVPNGVQLQPPARSREDVLAWFGIPRESRAAIVGQVAGLVPYKGQDVLVEAAQRLVAAGHDVRVLLVGDERMGPAWPQKLRSAAQRLGIADRLHVRAYPGNIADAWSIIDIHAHPSSIDSLPNAVIEGMSLGKPAVVSAVGAVPEHIDDGRSGLLVPPGDVAALSAALGRLLEDLAFAKRLGQGARARYLERFTPAVTARQMERCLESIARHRREHGLAGAPA